MKNLRNNLGIKIISLVVAFFLWSYVVAGVNPTQKMTLSNIPVKVVNKEKLSQRDLEVMGLDPEKISVSLSGKRHALGSIRPNDIQATVDVQDLQEGVHSLPVHFDIPNNVVINPDAATSSISIQVEKIINQSLPVRVDTTGEVGENYVVEKITANPNKIPCTGARSLIDRVQGLRAYIDISDLQADSSIQAKVVPVDAEGEEVEGVYLSLSEVRISILVSKQKLLPVEVAFQGKSPEGYRITDAKVDPHEILVKGTPKQIDSLTGLKSKPLEREKITTSGFYPIKLDLPAGVSLADPKQSISADILVETREIRNLTVPLSQATYPGLPSSLTGEAVDKSVEVVLEGFPQDLNKVNEDNLPVAFTSIIPGEIAVDVPTSLPIQISPPGEITVKEIQPQEARVVFRRK